MPLITLNVLAVAAGLLLGFGGFFLPSLVIAAGGLAMGVARHRRWGYASLGLAAGFAVASDCRRADEACLREVRNTGTALIRLRTDASADRRAFGTLVATRCAPVIGIESAKGRALAGATIAVRGRPKVTESGIVLTNAAIVVRSAPAMIDRWRAAVGRSIDDLYGPRAPLVRALVIADDRDVDRGVRDAFADAGIVHMLSVSGLHVAILGEAVALLFGVAGLSRRGVDVATMLTVACYVLLIGAPSPAVRSAVMLAAARVAQLRQRPTSAWAAWSLGALIPLAQPREVLGVGYQLSVAGMAALLAAGELLRRVRRVGPSRLRGLLREVTTTVIATAVTAPVVTAAFGRLSLIAPITNLVVAPLFALLQPALFLSLLLQPVKPAARWVADGAALLLDAVAAVANAAARVPGAVMAIMPSTPTSVALAVAAAAGVVACCSRHWARAALTALVSVTIALWSPLAGSGLLELHLLDVGQGDAVALRTPHGRWVVVDAGPRSPTRDAGAAVVVPMIRRRGGDVAVFALSHPHLDHVGGAQALLQGVHVAEMWDAARVYGGGAYESTLVTARDHGVTWSRVRPGASRIIDGVQFDVLAPDSTWTQTQSDPNTSSVVLLVTYGSRRILLTGDAESAEEGWLLSRYASRLGADILKVGHHGSTTSSTAEFVDAVHPRLALISVGLHNRYGHPSPEVLRLFDERQIEVLRTDYDGSIVVRTDGRAVWVTAHGDTWTLGGCRTGCSADR